jgi:hypothetical protein
MKINFSPPVFLYKGKENYNIKMIRTSENSTWSDMFEEHMITPCVNGYYIE